MSIVTANQGVCKTPGANYSISISHDVIGIRVDMPKHAMMPTTLQEAEQLHEALHAAVERVLAACFDPSKK